jgi:type I restriction-modification system DNA methylase subunit
VKQSIRSSAQAQKDFEKAIDRLAYTRSKWNVFEDFLDYTLISLRWHDHQPSMFDPILSKYTPDEKQFFQIAFESLGDMADNDGMGFHDPFGDYFMEHFGNKFKGQFFTPESVTDFMAQITIDKDIPDGATVCDCACGSGRTLLSAARINRKLVFYAADIDLNCCKMTLINFMLNTMCGEVAWMDTLKMDHWKSWHIMKVPYGTGYLPYYIETGAGETHFVERLKNTMQALESKPLEEELKVNKRGQLMLF